ncbi:5-methylcytosine restriction system specificity protein McrC [Ferruginibacter sp. SUN106]|uniref:5-methylcytosine restriction system specificity protein McrC n=1 Tax=Ferruginibacter sp. SUN106 TaxID=2978348 RepID=UPI003D367610
MQLNDCINIETKDCSLMQIPSEHLEAIKSFNTNAVAFNCFNFKTIPYTEESTSLLEYDYKNNSWWSSRYIGEANFKYNAQEYKLTIQPRFGELFLFRMFEEIFSIRLTHSTNKITKYNDIQFLIRKVISFIWVQLLANANKHGVPKKNVTRSYQGSKIKGKIDITKTIQSLTKRNLISSSYKEKAVDATISSIILRAYKILKTDYGLDSINLPDNAQDALNDLFAEMKDVNNVNNHQYRNIVYKDIYVSFKPLVDFSWDIIQRKNILNQEKSNKQNKGFSFFIDMAEVWELYLKSLLKRKLQPEGWKQVDVKHFVYNDKFYGRSIIPDIVLLKASQSVVLDAKYKRMYFFGKELDRTDFFQIHTYSGYYSINSNLIAAGLLYPITSKSDSIKLLSHHSKGLFGETASSTNFIVDGIDISFLNEDSISHDEKIVLMKEKETQFIDRLALTLKGTIN